MSSRLMTAGLVTLGLILLVPIAYFGFQEDSDPDPEETISPGSKAKPEEALSGTQLPDAEAKGSLSEGLDAPGQSVKRVDVVEQEEEKAAAQEEVDRQWVSGRVQFGFPIPDDEQIHVLSLDDAYGMRQLYGSDQIAEGAWDSEVENSSLHDSVRVEADGSFRVSLPAKQKSAYLALTGRYVFSRMTTTVRLPVEEDSIVLSGELGSWITGDLLPPKSDPTISMANVLVELGPDITSDFDAMKIAANDFAVERKSDDQGHFEFRGVSPAVAHGLIVRHDELAHYLELGIETSAGEHRTLDVSLQEGATLSGTVVGSDDGPVAGVDVNVMLIGQLGAGVEELRETKTDESGHFLLEHVLTGRKVQVNARPENMLGGRLRLEEKLRDGQVLDNLVIRVEAGNRVSGRVTFPDGQPAQGVKIDVGLDIAQITPQMLGARLAASQPREAQTAADGTFQVTGLDDGPFKVTAQLENEEGDRVGSWRANELNVQPGSSVDLELLGLCDLRGIVATASGLEIEAFRVSLLLDGSGGVLGFGAERLAEEFDAPEEDGVFTKSDVPPGLWKVRVKADGFAYSEAIDIDVPQAEGADLPVFDLVPSAAVAGTVVDTFGKPMPGAEVSLDLDLNARVSGVYSGEEPSVIADHEGNFLLAGLDPGSISLIARMEGFAGSEPVLVELISGQTTEGVELALRVGGTLTGHVMEDDGEPAEGKMVVAQSTQNYGAQHVMTSDSEGAFRAENLEPGQWQVISMPSPLNGELDVEGGDDFGTMLGELKMDTVEIEEGKESYVLLGEPPKDPIEVFGSVVHDGESVPGCLVSFIPEGAESLGDMKLVTCDDDGSFRVTLAQRGPYLVTIQHAFATGRENRVEMREAIPEEVPTYNMTLSLPMGGISGRVVGVDGRPAVGCRISLSVDEGIVFGTLLGGHYTEATTGEDGTYEIPYLAPGKYMVSAGGATLSGLLGDSSAVGRVVQSGIVVTEGQMIRGVDFRLKRPGVISGTVKGVDQRPVSGAAVFVRDREGRILDRITYVNTDSSGRFRYEGVAEGEYTIAARKGDLVSPSSDVIKIEAGGTAEAHVVIDEGTVLIVSVIDQAGNEVNARLSVKDSLGREMAGLRSLEELLATFSGTFSTMEQRVGPLPNGKYRVEAVLDDGRSEHKNINVSGRASRKVKLRVD